MTILIFFCFVYKPICQSDSIHVNILNDTIFYNKQDGKVYNFYGFVDDTIFVDTVIKFELLNLSKNDYCLIYDSSRIIPHNIFPWENQNILKMEQNYYFNAVLYDENDSIISSGGGFIVFDLDSMDRFGLDSVISIDNSERYNKVILKSHQKMLLKIRYLIPLFEGVHYMNKLQLSNVKKYYLKFYLSNRYKKAKQILSKKELKSLKKGKIKLLDGDMITTKKVPLLLR